LQNVDFPYLKTMRAVLSSTSVIIVACLMVGCAGAFTSDTTLPNLTAHQWRHRIVVIDTPSPQSVDYIRQTKALEAASAGLRERDVIIVTQVATTFRVRLIGKDGGVKFSRTTPVDAETLFDLIDAMPMRQAELSGR
jgi:hypothetical protein